MKVGETNDIYYVFIDIKLMNKIQLNKLCCCIIWIWNRLTLSIIVRENDLSWGWLESARIEEIHLLPLSKYLYFSLRPLIGFCPGDPSLLPLQTLDLYSRSVQSLCHESSPYLFQSISKAILWFGFSHWFSFRSTLRYYSRRQWKYLCILLQLPRDHFSMDTKTILWLHCW